METVKNKATKNRIVYYNNAERVSKAKPRARAYSVTLSVKKSAT
jgi:hypothetical protein